MQNTKLESAEETKVEKHSRRKDPSSTYNRLLPILFIGFAIILLLCLIYPAAFGIVGQWIHKVALGINGIPAFLIPILLILLAITRKKDLENHVLFTKYLTGLLLVIFTSVLFFIFGISDSEKSEVITLSKAFEVAGEWKGGGIVGNLIGYGLQSLIAAPGVVILYIIVLAFFLVCFFNLTPKKVYLAISKKVKENKAKKEEKTDDATSKPVQTSYPTQDKARNNWEPSREMSLEDREKTLNSLTFHDDMRTPDELLFASGSSDHFSGVRPSPIQPLNSKKTLYNNDTDLSLETPTIQDNEEHFEKEDFATSKNFPLDNDVYIENPNKSSKWNSLYKKENNGEGQARRNLSLFEEKQRAESIRSREEDLSASQPKSMDDIVRMTTRVSVPSYMSPSTVQEPKKLSMEPPQPTTQPISSTTAEPINPNPAQAFNQNPSFAPTGFITKTTTKLDINEPIKPPPQATRFDEKDPYILSPQDLASGKTYDKPSFNPVVNTQYTQPVTGVSSPDTAPAMQTSEPERRPMPNFATYTFPPTDFLKPQDYTGDSQAKAEVEEKMNILIQTLADYNVAAEPRSYTRGPRITRFEIVPKPGVRINSIVGLQNEIAMRLCAESVMVEAPIPGDSAIGIQVPNKHSNPVRIRGLIESEGFRNAKEVTTVALGRDIAGNPFFMSIETAPHLLVAGATGMGKSVCINTILTSILYKARPDEVRLILIDPKLVEFNLYQNVPHLLVPVINDSKAAIGALNWGAEEMDRRFQILKNQNARDLDDYNKIRKNNPSLENLPHIVIVIDELNDLKQTTKNPKQLEDVICRIAQKARAAGIHIIIGTQRPVVSVVTGNIKGNIPTRIAFKVIAHVDSTTILDSGGAEKLLDKGDMLFFKTGAPKRVQCSFVEGSEITQVVNYLIENNPGNYYDESVQEGIENATRAFERENNKKAFGAMGDQIAEPQDNGGHVSQEEKKFWKAAKLAIESNRLSTSLIQRNIGVGYAKAASFLDKMEELGIVGPQVDKKPREVLVTADEFIEMRNSLLGRITFNSLDDDDDDDFYGTTSDSRDNDDE